MPSLWLSQCVRQFNLTICGHKKCRYGLKSSPSLIERIIPWNSPRSPAILLSINQLLRTNLLAPDSLKCRRMPRMRVRVCVSSFGRPLSLQKSRMSRSIYWNRVVCLISLNLQFVISLFAPMCVECCHSFIFASTSSPLRCYAQIILTQLECMDDIELLLNRLQSELMFCLLLSCALAICYFRSQSNKEHEWAAQKTWNESKIDKKKSGINEQTKSEGVRRRALEGARDKDVPNEVYQQTRRPVLSAV